MKLTDFVATVWDNAKLLTEEPQAAKSIVARIMRTAAHSEAQRLHFMIDAKSFKSGV